MTPRFGNRVNGKGVNLYFISESRLPSLPFEPVFRIEFTPCPGQVVLFSELCPSPTRFSEDLMPPWCGSSMTSGFTVICFQPAEE